ncbi:MAG: 2,4-dihydroxyhept-2-ene-1,7-dioic acid aldolase [Planctomycetes bacterium]|nr:2,4-dihydroxyhept-2-ene-1,7-dioic acid aldolase [Planctomycetota bacterium]
MTNKLRSALLNGQVSLGAWMQIGHCAVAEIFARSGFDWVCVDLEHGAIDLETMTDIFRTLDGFDCVPVARLPLNDPVWIHRTLDAGARGLIIPMVKTAAEADAAIREAKYPPRGTRGYGYSRANMHGIDFADYIAAANDEIAMVMQIEHKDAIANLEAILDVPGVDGLFIGPLDLSGSMGITGQLDHPQMVAALDRYRSVCRDRKVTAGMHIVRPNAKNVAQALEQGYTLIALGLDNVFLDDSSRACLKSAGR